MTTCERILHINHKRDEPLFPMLPPKQVLRDRIARIIAATRFPFIDQTTWDEGRRTFVNTQKEKIFAIVGPRGKIYPSIVVLDPDGAIREIGEVEMEVESSLAAKWSLLSDKTGMGEKYKKLFIYVPLGEGNEAKRLLEEKGIEYAGLREWSIEEGVLVTRPVVTPDMGYDHRVS
jgi:hypothetical protein